MALVATAAAVVALVIYIGQGGRKPVAAQSVALETHVLPRLNVHSPASALNPEAVSNSIDSPKEVLMSIYDSDRTLREESQVEAARFMSEFDPIGISVLRWEPVLVNATSLINGSPMQEDSVVEQFKISPFPHVSFVATKGEYRIWEANNQASWIGSLDRGASGTIEIAIQLDEKNRPLFLFNIHTETHDFAIVPTELYGTYIAMDANRDGPKLDD